MIRALVLSYILAIRQVFTGKRARHLIDEAWDAGSVFMDSFSKGINDRAAIKARKKAQLDIGTD